MNLPIAPVVVTATPGDPATSNSGMEGASNASVIGVATGQIFSSVAESGFSISLSAPTSTNVLEHQYLGWGGDQTVSGQETADLPQQHLVNYADTDFNDTQITLATATIQAAVDAVYQATFQTVNRADRTIEIGEVLWGARAVA